VKQIVELERALSDATHRAEKAEAERLDFLKAAGHYRLQYEIALARITELEELLKAAKPAIDAWNDLQAIAEKLRESTSAPCYPTPPSLEWRP